MFQYIICYWFNSWCLSCILGLWVSIHYMLLVQFNLRIFSNCSSLFQYIICCWFNMLKLLIQRIKFRFQYIICCWFNELAQLKVAKEFLFQYIICCWFKCTHSRFWKEIRVSIHYMLLVQKTTGIFGLLNLIKFQYIICCWFNSTNSNSK